MGIKESILRLVIDSSAARQGADTFSQATAKAKDSATQAAVAVDKFQDTLKKVPAAADAAKQGTETLNTSNNKAKDSATAATAASEKFQETLKKIPAAAAAAKTATDQLNESHAKASQSANSAAAAANAIAESFKKAAASTSSASKPATDAVNNMDQSLKQATNSSRLFGDMTRLQGYQLTNLSYQIQDVVVQLSMGTSIFRVLIQQGGQIATAFGGFGNLFKGIISPIGLAIAAVGALVGGFVAMISAGESLNRTMTQIQAGFTLTGRTAQYSNTELRALIDEASRAVGISRSEATAALAELSRLKNIGGKNLEELLRISGDLATALGKDIPTAAADAGRGLRDPIGYVTELSKQLGGLTTAEYEQIRAAQKAGDVNKATGLAIDYMSRAVKNATKESMTPLQQSLDSLGKSWSSLTSAFANSSWVQAAVDGVSKFTGALAFLLNLDMNGDKAKKSMAEGQVLGSMQLRQAQEQKTPFDAAAAADLRRQFGGITTQREDLSNQIKAMESFQKQDAGNWDLYSASLARAKAQLAALKDEATYANEELQREASILAQPINKREIYRAGVEAAASALRAGKTASEAAAIAHVAEAKAVLQARTAYNDLITSIDQQIAQTEFLTAAREQGALAAVKQQAANQAYSEHLKNASIDVKVLTDRLYELRQAQDRDALAQQQSQANDELSLARESLNIAGRTKDEREVELGVMRKQQEILRQNPTLTAAQIQPILETTRRQIELNNQASKMSAIYDEARNTLADAFSQVLEGGIKKFSDFTNIIKNMFIKLAAQIAQSLIFQPIVNGILGGTGSSVLFGSGGLGASGVAGSGGSGLLSGIGNLFGFSGSGGLLDSLGTSLGFASGNVAAAPSAAFVGPMPLESGSLFGTTSLSGLLGGIGAGFGAGSLLNGLLGGNSTGGTIGSGVGAAAGAAIGSIVPGIGTLIGGLIGGAGGGIFGGLFGPKKSVGPNANTNLNIVNGRLAVGETGADNGGDRAGTIQLAQNAVTQINKLIDTYGVKAYDPYGGALSHTGAPHAIGFEVYTGNVNAGKPQTPDDVLQFMRSHGLLKGDTAEYQKIVSNSKATTVADFAKDLDIGKLIEDARNLNKALDSVQQSFKDLSDQADDYVKRAANLGISTKSVLDALAATFNKSITDSIKQIQDPYQAAYDSLIKDQQARLDYAKKIGADITQVEKLNLLEQKQLMVQYGKDTTAALQKMSDDLMAYLNKQELSGNSSLTPYEQFQRAQDQFRSSVDTARSAGSTADIGSVTSAADTLLNLGKNALGGATTDYTTLERMVRSMLQSLGTQLGLPGFTTASAASATASSSSSTGSIPSWQLPALYGFATGGDFDVKGNGGTDSQVVAFKATPGENVRVLTPNQQRTEQLNLHVMVNTLQKGLSELKKEMRDVNDNLSRSRARNLVVRQ